MEKMMTGAKEPTDKSNTTMHNYEARREPRQLSEAELNTVSGGVRKAGGQPLECLKITM
jgi:hypothetical protein